MAANATPLRAVINVGLAIACNTLVDLKNPDVVAAVRAVYVIVALFCYMQVQGLPARLEALLASGGARPRCWVPVEKKAGLAALLGGAKPDDDKPKWVACESLLAHELSAARTRASAAVMTAVQPLIFSWLMSVHIVVAMQVRVGGGVGGGRLLLKISVRKRVHGGCVFRS